MAVAADKLLAANASKSSEPEPRTGCLGKTVGKTCNFVKKNILLICLLFAVFFGIIVGVLLRMRAKPYSKREIMYANFLGTLLIRMLLCVTIPLFVTSIMASLGRLDMKTSRNIAFRALAYILATSCLSSIIGIIIVVVVRPGVGKTVEGVPSVGAKAATLVDSILDIIRNMFPSNLIEACIYTHSTVLKEPENYTSGSKYDWDFSVNQLTFGTNYLGLIVVAVVLGFSMGFLGQGVLEFTEFIETINDLCITITFLIIAVSPPGIFCLIVGQILEVKDFAENMRQVGLYTLCVCIGLLIVYVLITPTIYVIFMRKSPLMFMYNALPVMTTAFATSSSLATLPTTLHCVEDLNHVDPRISRFIIPLAATINMNGASMYNTIGPLFLAQLSRININIGHYIAVCITATLASVGVAGIPQGGMVTMILVMNILSVQPEMVAVVYTVDWILDRLCTAVNVMGDILCAQLLEKWSAKELQAQTMI